MENIKYNTSYDIETTNYNVTRIFLNKFKTEELFKRYISTKLSKPNYDTDFTNSEFCGIIGNE